LPPVDRPLPRLPLAEPRGAHWHHRQAWRGGSQPDVPDRAHRQHRGRLPDRPPEPAADPGRDPGQEVAGKRFGLVIGLRGPGALAAGLRGLYSVQALCAITERPLMKLDLSCIIRNSPVLADVDKQKKRGRNYLVSAFVGAIFVAIVLAIWPDTLPFTYFQFWTTKGTVLDWLQTSWPIFAWGMGLTTLASILTRNKPEENRNAEGNLAKGFAVSVWAGLMEEICFSWLIFMS